MAGVKADQRENCASAQPVSVPVAISIWHPKNTVRRFPQALGLERPFASRLEYRTGTTEPQQPCIGDYTFDQPATPSCATDFVVYTASAANAARLRQT